VRKRKAITLRSADGASAVEFALILSVLFLFVFGTIQFGIAYNRDQGLKAAAREGARIASVGGTQMDVKTRVQQAQSLFNASDIQVVMDYSTDNGATWPGNQKICDDGSGNNKCTSNVAPGPCGVAGVGNLVRVNAVVPPPAANLNKYAIIIPLWGNARITFSAQGVFRCEQT
jgi:Flp pilus assembly protein TadG